MARAEGIEQAAADGIRVEHDPAQSRFVALRDEGETTRIIGEAHYTLIGDSGSERAKIDFDHTYVVPEWRGTGVSELLATQAFTSDVAAGRSVQTSCSYMRLTLMRHPELRS